MDEGDEQGGEERAREEHGGDPLEGPVAEEGTGSTGSPADTRTRIGNDTHRQKETNGPAASRRRSRPGG